MATYEYNDKIKFMLPAGYLFLREEDDEGDEVVNITAGEYEDDEGETCYKFTCRVSYTEYNPPKEDGEEITSDNLLDSLAEIMGVSRRLKIPGKPRTMLLNKGVPLSILGSVINMYVSLCLVQVSDWSVLYLYNDDDPQENTERYEYLYEVLKATRINGKKLPVDSISPAQIEEALQVTFDEDDPVNSEFGWPGDEEEYQANWEAEDDAESLAETMGDLSAQIAEMESQELSAEDRERLQNIKGLMNDLSDQLAEGLADMDKYSDYLKQEEAREKAEEEEKARKKAEAKAAGKSEKDIVNMYIILTNEKKLGQLHRAQEKFYEIYEKDFAALSKTEVIQTRKDMLAEMEDDSLCSYYAESFKQRSIEDRFSVSTANLNNVSENPELGEKAEWAIENSKEWYTPDEYAEVRRLMDADMADRRKQLDDQLKSIDEGWTQYSTAKDSLQIVITDAAADDSDMQPNFSNFQIVTGSQLVSVHIATKGMVRISLTVMDCFTWYWGVTVRDIWEIARKNEVSDKREGAYNGDQLADQALNQIRAKHPAMKVTSSTSTYSKATSTPSYTATSTSNNTSINNAQRSNTSATSSQQTQPAKKEGCYIATAVYGSYDAPEVMTLRRFRDETLRNSAFGRWFIRMYYRLSPPVAERLKNAKHVNAFVRSILNKCVDRLNYKQR